MNIFAKNTLLLVLMNMLSGSVAQAAEPSHFAHFITRQGAQLMDGSQLFRFAGIHAPELHRIEDDARGVCKADPRGWGQPQMNRRTGSAPWYKPAPKRNASTFSPCSRRMMRLADERRIFWHRQPRTACRA